jgi:dTDP-4-dehydrorhamnose reductase
METALIGHTGFVGGVLKAQQPFDELYASRNIDAIRGKHFRFVVCAGASAVKWKAIQDPGADLAAIEKLLSPLREVKAERFVLVSTVDVYEHPVGVDEDAPADATHAYGRHRRLLEELVQERFADRATILRLPGLFGPGLKKNVIYDLLHEHQLDRIHPDGLFQYYPLAHLSMDISAAINRGIPLLNVAAEPIATCELSLRCFGRELRDYPAAAPARYDIRSKHAASWGGVHYLYGKAAVLAELKAFVESERGL